MLNFHFCTTSKINILTPVLSKKNISKRKKTHSRPPPCKLSGWSLMARTS